MRVPVISGRDVLLVPIEDIDGYLGELSKHYSLGLGEFSVELGATAKLTAATAFKSAGTKSLTATPATPAKTTAKVTLAPVKVATPVKVTAAPKPAAKPAAKPATVSSIASKVASNIKTAVTAAPKATTTKTITVVSPATQTATQVKVGTAAVKPTVAAPLKPVATVKPAVTVAVKAPVATKAISAAAPVATKPLVNYEAQILPAAVVKTTAPKAAAKPTVAIKAVVTPAAKPVSTPQKPIVSATWTGTTPAQVKAAAAATPAVKTTALAIAKEAVKPPPAVVVKTADAKTAVKHLSDAKAALPTQSIPVAVKAGTYVPVPAVPGAAKPVAAAIIESKACMPTTCAPCVVAAPRTDTLTLSVPQLKTAYDSYLKNQDKLLAGAPMAEEEFRNVVTGLLDKLEMKTTDAGLLWELNRIRRATGVQIRPNPVDELMGLEDLDCMLGCSDALDGFDFESLTTGGIGGTAIDVANFVVDASKKSGEALLAIYDAITKNPISRAILPFVGMIPGVGQAITSGIAAVDTARAVLQSLVEGKMPAELSVAALAATIPGAEKYQALLEQGKLTGQDAAALAKLTIETAVKLPTPDAPIARTTAPPVKKAGAGPNLTLTNYEASMSGSGVMAAGIGSAKPTQNISGKPKALDYSGRTTPASVASPVAPAVMPAAPSHPSIPEPTFITPLSQPAFVEPTRVVDKSAAARQLASLIGAPIQDVLARVSKMNFQNQVTSEHNTLRDKERFQRALIARLKQISLRGQV